MRITIQRRRFFKRAVWYFMTHIVRIHLSEIGNTGFIKKRNATKHVLL